eukprot:m.42746 g.42746  ORF g.42746 m.42746 type:complete len:67 (-) comp9908_c0_seq1:316-516(-)
MATTTSPTQYATNRSNIKKSRHLRWDQETGPLKLAPSASGSTFVLPQQVMLKPRLKAKQHYSLAVH